MRLMCKGVVDGGRAGWGLSGSRPTWRSSEFGFPRWTLDSWHLRGFRHHGGARAVWAVARAVDWKARKLQGNNYGVFPLLLFPLLRLSPGWHSRPPPDVKRELQPAVCDQVGQIPTSGVGISMQCLAV
ncbi:hypothetical protein BT67DRAFT_54256 [Trichocladium antarcticum]|uniref:Uncharacterized protein n=1 Tax=Trichocladium antarcticum TaxID=1450529 RepID=A0AAN6UIE0_9PEZI|nr:hypothetical protein BT67DRAFT_54256 [Trichocladium antarcticum]